MTPRRKDSLLIATAFVAILGAGFGLGNLLGPHRAAARRLPGVRGQARSAARDPAPV